MTLSELFKLAHKRTRETRDAGRFVDGDTYASVFVQFYKLLYHGNRAAIVAEQRRVKDSDSLLTAVAKLGGLQREQASAEGVDPASFQEKRAGIRYVFTKRGRSLDALVPILDGYGYFYGQRQACPNTLLDMIQEEVQGQCTHYGIIAAEQQLQADYDERNASDLGIDPLIFGDDWQDMTSPADNVLNW